MKKEFASIAATLLLEGCASRGAGPEVALSEFPEGATLLRVYSADYDENSGWYVTASCPVAGNAESDRLLLRVADDISAGFQAQGGSGGRVLSEYSGAESVQSALKERGNTSVDCTFTLEDGVITGITEINDFAYK